MRFRSLVRVTPPSSEPVSLEVAKQHLRVEHDDDDAVVTLCIASAREWCETYLDATLLYSKWKMTFDYFPVEVRLPKPPMAAHADYDDVVVTYTDDANGVTTLDASEYRVDREGLPGILRPLYSGSWPPHRADFNACSVTWWAGYGETGDSLPESIKVAVLMLMTHFYEDRSEVLVGQGVISKHIEFGVRALLDSNRWGSYA